MPTMTPAGQSIYSTPTFAVQTFGHNVWTVRDTFTDPEAAKREARLRVKYGAKREAIRIRRLW